MFLDVLHPGAPLALALLGLAARLLIAAGTALFFGAVVDLVRHRRRPPMDMSDFSLSAMRDRRARKLNGYLFRSGALTTLAGVGLLGVVSLVT
jgi:hypothetical protein